MYEDRPRPLLRLPYLMPQTRIVYGAGVAQTLADELDFLELRRAVVVCGANAARGPAVGRLRATLGATCVDLFAGVRPQTPATTVRDLAEVVAAREADVLVAVGGGSTIDTAKAATALLAEGGPLEALASRFTPPDHYVERYLKRPKIPLVAVPTTLSGSEINPTIAVKGDAGQKLLLRGEHVAPRVVVLDPQATCDAPLDVFLASGMNGLAHALEGLYSRQRQPLSDALAKEAIALFSQHLPALAADPSNLDTRQALLFASVMGGLVVTNARVGIHHAVCHALGAHLGLSHGLANAILLPYALEFNLPATVEQQAQAARAMGVEGRTPEAAARAAIARVRELQRAIGVPQRLRDLPRPPPRSALRGVAHDTLTDRALYFNPRPIDSEADVLQLLEAAW